MAIVNPRYRVVTFRLSSQEYEEVYSASEMEGARSLSDFARRAALDRARKTGEPVSDQERLQTLSERSDQMVELLTDIGRKLSNVCGAKTHDIGG